MEFGPALRLVSLSHRSPHIWIHNMKLLNAVLPALSNSPSSGRNYIEMFIYQALFRRAFECTKTYPETFKWKDYNKTDCLTNWGTRYSRDTN